MAQLSTTEMDHEKIYENTAMMDHIYTPVIESLPPADDSEVRRIRKFLLIILSICLVSFLLHFLFTIRR